MCECTNRSLLLRIANCCQVLIVPIYLYISHFTISERRRALYNLLKRLIASKDEIIFISIPNKKLTFVIKTEKSKKKNKQTTKLKIISIISLSKIIHPSTVIFIPFSDLVYTVLWKYTEDPCLTQRIGLIFLLAYLSNQEFHQGQRVCMSTLLPPILTSL